jgi:hypothetical protein
MFVTFNFDGEGLGSLIRTYVLPAYKAGRMTRNESLRYVKAHVVDYISLIDEDEVKNGI